MDNERATSVLLAIYGALLGAIPAHLRAITARWGETDIHFDCFYDGAITELDQETMEIVETEISSHYPVTHSVTHTRHRLDFPAAFPNWGRSIFHRQEDLPPFG